MSYILIYFFNCRQISRLKDQNKLLTEEVSKKSQAITVLDQEKSALIRELFQVNIRCILLLNNKIFVEETLPIPSVAKSNPKIFI